MRFGFCFVLFCLVLFFSIGFVSAVDFDGSGSGVLVDGGSVADFNGSGHGSLFDGGVSVLNGSVSSGYVYLDSDTVFDEDFDEGFVEPLDGLDDVGVSGVDAVKTSTRVVGSDVVKYYLNGSRLVFGLKDSANNYLANKPMKVYFSNKIYNRTTDGSGMGFLNINLKPGNYSFNVKFLGDSSYSASNKVIRVTVNKMPTSITASNIIKDYGGSERLVATLKDAHGNPLTDKNLTVNITGVSRIYTIGTNASGSASLAINLKPQVTNARISFSQTNYISSQKTITITINTLLASITSDNVEKFYGQATPWTARLLDKNGNPLSGETLNFQVASGSYNKTTDNNGYAHIGINFSPRNVTGTVSFSKIGYGTVSKNVNILVKAIPNTIISSNVDKYYGESTPWTARLVDNDGNPLSNKTLNFQVASGSYNKTTDDNGYAHVGINFSPRNVTGTVRFSETGYASTSKNVNILVKPIPNTIISSNVDKYYGDDDVWTARLVDNDGNPLSNKTLNFQVASGSYNKTTDDNGYAHVGINFSPRNVTGTVRFSETGFASTSENVNILVRNKQSTITCSNLNTHINESRDLVAILKGNNNQPLPNKSITFNISGNIYSRTTDNNGRAVYTFPQTPINTNVSVSFRENYYENSSKTVNANIKYWTSTITANNQTAYYGQAIPLTATLKGENNQPLAGKTIRIIYNNKNISRTTDSNGNINYSFLENAGNYSVQLRFNENYNTNCTKTVQITVNKIPTSIISNSLSYYVNETQNLTAQLKDNNNNPLSYKTLTFNVSGTIYSRTTDSNGYANLNIGSNLGYYNVGISFADSNYISSSKNITISVNLLPSNLVANNISAHYGENVVLTATLKGLNNINLPNKNIKISYNNKSFNRITNSNGQVFLDFNETPGNYNVNISFNDTDYQYVSKNINVNILAPNAPNVNVSSGFYNLSNLLVNVSSNLINSTLFCSFDNGTSWEEYNESICFNLSEGVWDISAYSFWKGFNSSIINCSFAVGNSSPLAWASTGSGIYNESFEVNLTAFSSVDDDAVIYYTLDGNQPDTGSSIYNSPIFISNSSYFNCLRFFALDKYGHSSDIITVYYLFGEIIVNLNNGKTYYSIQDAIFDDDTNDGDIIESSLDLNEFAIVNKNVHIRSCDFKHTFWTSDNSYDIIYLDEVENTIIEGFIFYYEDMGNIINLGHSSNCFILDNCFLNEHGTSIFDDSNSNISSKNNSIMFNRFYSGSTNPIHLNNIENFSFISNAFNIIDYTNDELNYYLNFNSYDFNYINAIIINDSFNSIFYANEFSNGTVAINISNGNDNCISDNNFFNNSKSLSLNGSNNSAFNNSFISNEFAIVLNGANNRIISNNILNNSIGIFSNGLTDSQINFNRITGNADFGAYIAEGSVNITNNWWGHNNISLSSQRGDIYYVDGLNHVFEPYLVLSIYATDYIIRDYYVNACSFVADLTHNNFGEDVSTMGSIPLAEILFRIGCYLNTTHNPRFSLNEVNEILVCGKSSISHSLQLDNNITAILDNENVSYYIGSPPQSIAQIYINSTAIDLNTGNPLDACLNLSLNSSINWFTTIWKSHGLFEDEVLLIVDGNVVDSFIVMSSYYYHHMNAFSSDVFNSIDLYNRFLYNEFYSVKAQIYVWIALSYGLSNLQQVEEEYYSGRTFNFSPFEFYELLEYHNTDVSSVLLSLLKNTYSLSYEETAFIGLYHNMFMDEISANINYFGNDDSNFIIHCDETDESFTWKGNSSSRNAIISYNDGTYAYTIGDDSPDYYENWQTSHFGYDSIFWAYHNSYGIYDEGLYDGFLTFTFASDKVSDELFEFWLNEKNRTCQNGSLYYDIGFMKAAYGSFIEGLDVIYCNDMVADIAAESFNITWNRTSPMVMSVHDDIAGTVLSGESSFYFGRTAYGNPEDSKHSILPVQQVSLL